MASTKRKIIKNTIFNASFRFWVYIINFFLFPFIVFHVGVEDYGLYLLVNAFAGYFGLLDMGVGAAITKYVAEYKAKNDETMINKIVNSTFIFYLITGIIICISMIIVGIYYTEFFEISSGSLETARMLAFLVAINALVSWPLKSFITLFGGLQRYDLNAILGFAIGTINAVATVAILLMGYGIVEVIFAGIIINSVGSIARVIVVKQMVPYLSLNKKYISIKTLKSVFKFSSIGFIQLISMMLILGIDRVVLGLFVSVSAITFYAVARKLHDVIENVADLPQSALLPAASELNALKKEEELEKLIIRGGKYKAAAILGFTSVMIPLAGPIIRVWMGEEYLFMTFPTQVFLSYWLLYAAWGVLNVVLLAKENFKPLVILILGVAIPNVFISIILTWQYGTIGVIWGTVIPYLAILPFVIPYAIKTLGINGKNYFKGVIAKAYPPIILSFTAIYLIVEFIPLTNLITVGLVGLAGLIIYFGTFFAVGMEKYERDQVKRYFGLSKVKT